LFKKVFYVAVIALFVFIAIGYLLPREVHVERSVQVSRPPSTVHVLLNNLRTFNRWSPWARRDPGMKVLYEGPVEGVGAAMSWEGDPRLVGSGRQQIIESRQWSLVRSSVQMDQQGRAQMTFTISPHADGAVVTWAFDADLAAGQGFFGGVLARYFGLFFDQWIGGDYEQGLSAFKAFAESLPATDFAALDAEVVEAQPVPILYIPANSSQDPDDIAGSLAAAYAEITAFMAAHDIAMAGQPMAITRGWNEEGYRFDAAIPVAGINVELTGRLNFGQSPAGRAVRVVHRGPYDDMAPSYEKLAAYMAVHGLAEGDVSWEQYISDPGETAAVDLVTHIYFRVADD
jgi:effector-binding domain-containing protein